MYRLLCFLTLIICVTWFATNPNFGAILGVTGGLAGFFRDELHGLIGRNFITLTPKSLLIRNFSNLKFSFTDKEYINPQIVEDLYGWISDTGDQVLSINILESNNSNRYFGDILIKETDSNPIIECRHNGGSFAYQYIGCSFSGMHILRTWWSGGGSGVFCSLLLVIMNKEIAIEFKKGKTYKINRIVIKKITDIPLGDRYDGDIKYNFGILTIGEDKYNTSQHSKLKFPGNFHSSGFRFFKPPCAAAF